MVINITKISTILQKSKFYNITGAILRMYYKLKKKIIKDRKKPPLLKGDLVPTWRAFELEGRKKAIPVESYRSSMKVWSGYRDDSRLPTVSLSVQDSRGRAPSSSSLNETVKRHLWKISHRPKRATSAVSCRYLFTCQPLRVSYHSG